ncbi:prolyl 4-hydroxylase subunit alpha-3 isoform X4 [Heterocephalus glaber]|uniref:Prolyl 4-hydroxylase subunit alpha-3 isoform X4 n=1 Tax=Heterocephalus glaber TaxID=10181 RepID=A0AAX6RRN0_HETGA|nr:prolyl 4-hydroxylase subunit alpha-3 isoform X4 [Heterocephalus glaber]
MLCAARLGALLAVLALWVGDQARAAAREDKFSALTSVARALAPERRLLALLRSYLLGEEARLRDLTRFYDKVAYDMGDYYHAIPWLEEAVSLFRGSYGEWKTEDEASLEDALDHLAFACFQAGNVSCALSLSREFLLYSPENKRMVRNVLKYERLLAENPHQAVAETVIQRPNVPHLQTRDTYEGLCQTLGSQPIHYQIPGLYCSYETNSSPYLLLQPVRKEVIHLEPYVALYHDFVSDPEAQKIRKLAEPWLQRSVVASGEKQLQVEYRISKSAWLKDTADPVLVTLDHRIAALTGLDVQHPYAEYLQVVNYGIGGHYEPHFDHATSPSSPLYRMKSGNRVATFMIYLSSVEAGGATAFIYANFSVPVVKNAALFWWNLHRSGEGDGDTLHAGCPVLVGDKWGMLLHLLHAFIQGCWSLLDSRVLSSFVLICRLCKDTMTASAEQVLFKDLVSEYMNGPFSVGV